MIKRILSIILAVAMLGSVATVIASAEETTEKTYKYVALGDSIAAGYGLTASGTANDPALILSEDLIANPIQDAYAHVFGERLAEIGAEYGYTTTATNLATTAYRAEDVAKTITTEGYKGTVAAHILEAFVGQGASEALVPYHDIFNNYLPDADMVSIQLGGNDIVMGIIYPMIQSGNPILNDTATAVALLLFGQSPTVAVGAGVKMLMRDKDLITADHIAEAVAYFGAITDNADMYVQNAADNVEEVVKTVQEVNPDADIALIGMYNPYGNSLEYEGQVRDICTVMQNMFVKAVDEAVDIEIAIGEKAGDETSDIPAEAAEQVTKELDGISISWNKYIVDNSYFEEMQKERVKALLTIAANELAYPIQYLTAGKNVEPQMLSLNEKLTAIAERNNATYVNVYDISNECNTDPHPTAAGHKEIADRLEATMNEIIRAKMAAAEPEKPTILLGDVDGDGQVLISDVTALQRHIAEIEEEGFVEAAADIDGDGEITINDVTQIQYYVAEMPVDYPIGEPIQ